MLDEQIEDVVERRVGSRYDPGYVVHPRVRMRDVPVLATRTKKALLTPRPIDLLEGLRVPGLAPIDHLVLEVMISSAYQQLVADDAIDARLRMAAGATGPRGLWSQGHASIIPVRALTALLGPGYGTTQIAGSLGRLLAARASLPELVIPKRRRTTRIVQVEYLEAMREEGAVPDLSAQPAAPKAYVSRSVGGRFTPEVRARIAAYEHELRLKVRQTDPGRAPDLEPPAKALRKETVDGRMRFSPVSVAHVHGSYVIFRLHPTFDAWLDPERLVDWRRVPYAYLDLRVLAAFKNPYAVPLYRHLVAQSYDREHRRVRFDETWTWEIACDDLARKVGYKTTTGGVRGAMMRSVLDPIAAELASHTDLPQIEVLPKRNAKDRSFHIRVHLPLPSDLRRFGAKRTLREPMRFEEIARADLPQYSLTASAVHRVAAHLRIDPDGVRGLAEAWRLAIDEIASDLDHTGSRDQRRYRGVALQKLLYKLHRTGQPTDRAFVGFALEEVRDPDLTADRTRHRLDYEGMTFHADDDRRLRLAEAKGLPPKRVERAIREGFDAYYERVIAERVEEERKALEKRSESRRKARRIRRDQRDQEIDRLSDLELARFEAITGPSPRRVAEAEMQEMIYLALEDMKKAERVDDPMDDDDPSMARLIAGAGIDPNLPPPVALVDHLTEARKRHVIPNGPKISREEHIEHMSSQVAKGATRREDSLDLLGCVGIHLTPVELEAFGKAKA